MASDFWKMYSERKKKKQAAGGGTSSFWKMYNDRKWQNHGEEIANNLSDRVNAWFENSGSAITESNNRYANRDNAFYVTDSADWLSSVTGRKAELDAERDAIRSILGIYSPYLNSDWVKQVNSAFDTESRTLSDIVNNAALDNDFWSSFTKEEYESAYDSQTYGKKYEGKTYAEIQDALKQSASDREKTWLSANADSFMTSADAQAEIDRLEKEKKEKTDSLSAVEWVKDYMSGKRGEGRETDGIEERIAELETIQSNAKKREELDYFNSKLPEATEYGNKISRYLYSKSPQSDSLGYKNDGPIARKEVGTEEFDGEFEEQLKALNQGSILNSGIFRDMFSYTESMNEEEKDIYNYVYVTEGEDRAFEYYKLIEEDLKKRVRKATADFVKNQSGVNKALLYGAFSVAGGTDSAVSGLSQLFAEDKVSASGLQYTSQELSKDLSGIKKNLYQAGYAIGNMLPMMLVSSSLGAVGAPARAAQLAGAGTLGASAGGNAYGQALSEGYSKDKARDYGILVGASEAGLQYLLGGIGKLGGVTDDVLLSKVSTIDNTLARLTLTGAVKIGSEITEEELQNYLEPAFRTIIFGEEYDAPTAEEFIETAIVTALSTAMLEGADIVLDDSKLSAGKEKLSENEQKVLDRVYNDYITEAEKEGKLSAREKREIRDRLTGDMKKGYISTDTIESILNEESYAAYRNSSEKENTLKAKKTALSEEIEALLDKPNPTIRDSERLGEARKQLRKVEQELQNSDTGMLKQKLSDEMSRLTGNDTYLKASYSERAKRSQAFEADLSKYNEKQRAVVQKAVESGFLNNTGRTHEFVDVIAKISADRGVSFDFTNNAKLKESGFAVEGKTVNGYVTKDGITINMDSPKAWQSTVGHEVTHILEGSELYSELQSALFRYAEAKGDYQSRLDAVTRLYENVKGADINSELTAELVGEYLFTDADFVRSLSAEHRNVFQKIYDEIKYLCRVVTAGSREARALEKVKKAFEKAYRENGKKTDVWENGTDAIRYSLSYTTDNRAVAVIENDIFDGRFNELSESDRIKIVKNAIKEFRPGVPVSGRLIGITRKSAEHFTNSDYTDKIRNNDPKLYEDKMNIAQNIDDVIYASTDYINEAPKHPRKDNITEFARGTVLLNIGGNKYKADVIVGYTSMKETVLYDVQDLTSTDFELKEKKAHPKLAGNESYTRRTAVPSDSIISQKEPDVKKKIKASPTHGSNPVHSVGNALSDNSVSQNDPVVNSKGTQKSEKNSLSEDYLPIEEGDIAPVGKNAVPARALKLEDSLSEDIAPAEKNVKAEKQLFDLLSDDNFTYYHAGKILDDPALKAAFENATGIDLTGLSLIGNKNFLKNVIVASREQGLFATEESASTIRKRDETVSAANAKADKAAAEKKQAIKTVWALTHNRSISDITAVIHSPLLSRTFEEIYRVKLTGSNSNKRKQIDAALNSGKRISRFQADSLVRSVRNGTFAAETAGISMEPENSFSDDSLPTRSDIKENGKTAAEVGADAPASIPIRKDIQDSGSRTTEDLPAAEEGAKSDTDSKPVQTAAERIAERLNNLNAEVENYQNLRKKNNKVLDKEIEKLQKRYDARKRKDTRSAKELLRRIEEIRRIKENADADYAKRISSLKENIKNTSTPERLRAEQGRVKRAEYQKEASDRMGDTSKWKDKKLGISYMVNTLRRNLRDIVRDADGNADIERADAIYDWLGGGYNHNEALLKKETAALKKPFFDMKISRAESVYIQMLGEYKYNPATMLKKTELDEYYEAHKKKIDLDKVEKAIGMAREIYDDLIKRVNAVLREHGMKEIPYREGYFPHFHRPTKNSFLGRLLNWKSIENDDIPTDIAGLTESFKPSKSSQGFSKQRRGDTTEYNFAKGFDTYVHGALDWIYHIGDIQRRRAFENEIRYRHSEKGVQERIDQIQSSTELDTDEMQELMDTVYAEAANPLNNFIVDFRNATNSLAGKKSTMDRGMEYATNRKVYATMTAINSRVSANMIAGSVASAITNLIPITQSWAQVSPVSSLFAVGDMVRSAFRDDGMIEKSDYMTNRLMEEEKLDQGAWDKIENALGVLNVFDRISTEVVWRSKYRENLKAGMSETEAIKNADIFAENVMAGRSRGNAPTIFNAKNPFIKMATSFQLEVMNQYGYMLKDMPQDIGKENIGKLTSGYIKMFAGAYLFNAMFSALTGRDAAFDPIGILEQLLRDLLGDDDEEEGSVTGAVGNLAKNVVQEVPFVGGILGGGRVPISSALPYDLDLSEFLDDIEGMYSGDAEKYKKSFFSELLKPVTYAVLPMGGGQLKKTVQGLSMFTGDKEVTGSYTNAGNLRFPVEATVPNVLQAALFGQYASENAREYFDNGYAPLTPKQTEEYAELGLPISDYRDIRKGLTEAGKTTDKSGYVKYTDDSGTVYWYDKETGTVFDEEYRKSDIPVLDLEKASATAQKADYIAGLPIDDRQKDILYGNAVSSSLTDEYGYQKYTDSDGNVYWYDQNAGIMYDSDYDAVLPEEAEGLSPAKKPSLAGYDMFADFEEFDYSIKNPEKYTLSRAITDTFSDYQEYTDALDSIKSDYDRQGNAVSGSRKKKVWAYINGLDLDYGQKLLLFKSEYKSDSTYDYMLLSYLGDREDISYEDLMSILGTLGLDKYRTYYGD